MKFELREEADMMESTDANNIVFLFPPHMLCRGEMPPDILPLRIICRARETPTGIRAMISRQREREFPSVLATDSIAHRYIEFIYRRCESK